jgi:hypothetical protein
MDWARSVVELANASAGSWSHGMGARTIKEASLQRVVRTTVNLQQIIDTRLRYYLEIQVERMLSLPELNERQWHALHYAQFLILLYKESFPTET